MGCNKPRTLDEIFDYIYENSIVGEETGCWLWQGSRDHLGYGKINYNAKKKAIHRLAYERYCGEIVEGVYHTCDIRNCWNPDHLFTGTQSDNMADAYRKGMYTRRQLK